jgi:hypothetical protein
MTLLNADFEIHSGWGNHIEWFHPEQFKNLTNKTKIDVYGHLPVIPKVGQTLSGEFKNSFKEFKFVEVRKVDGIHDMFFAKVVHIGEISREKYKQLTGG